MPSPSYFSSVLFLVRFFRVLPFQYSLSVLSVFSVVVIVFKSITIHPNRPSYPWWPIKLDMEEGSSQEAGITRLQLAELPPPPEGLLSTDVSPLLTSGHASHPEGSGDLRVSPSIAAELTSSTTTSTNRSASPKDAEHPATEPAISTEPRKSSPTGSRAARGPVSFEEPSETQSERTGASSNILPLDHSGVPGGLSTKQRGKAVSRPQSLLPNSSLESPPSNSSSNPAPGPSGASSNACEQMVASQAPPLSHRDAIDDVLGATLPSRDNPPFNANGDPARHAGKAVPPFSHGDFPISNACLPVSNPVGSFTGMTEHSLPSRPAAESLSGNREMLSNPGGPAPSGVSWLLCPVLVRAIALQSHSHHPTYRRRHR